MTEDITKITETMKPPIKRAKILSNRRPSEHQRDMAEQFGEWREDQAEEQKFLRALQDKRRLRSHFLSTVTTASPNKPAHRCNTLAETANQ